MKSIKEQSTVNVVAKDAKSYEIGFEAGANYVLECIEESIKNSPAGYGLIYYIIEQLKK